MSAERAPGIDRNAAAATLARLDPAAVPPGRERPRALGLLVEAQRRLRAGDGAAAVRACRELLRHEPDSADGHNLLGVALGSLGEAADGERAARRALALRPCDPGYLLNLGNRLAEQARADEAITAWREALVREPRHAGVLAALAGALAAAGRVEEAVEAAGRLAACPGLDAPSLARCGGIMAAAGDLAVALDLYGRALDLAPGELDWWLEAGRLALALDRIGLATEAAERALALEPGHVEARVLLAGACFRARRLERALELLDGLPLDGPEAADIANLRGMALLAQARVEEGLAAMAATRDLAPDSTVLQMTRVMYLNYHPTLERAELAAEHRRFGLAFAGAVPSLPPVESEGDPERRLRIGYLSPDLRLHSVAYFVAPLLEAYDRERFATFAYAHLIQADAVSLHFKGLVDGWRDVTRLDHAALARQIREDRIDILVDLGGLTKDSRLLACTGRPAPIQISWLGYPNTTGLPQIDYRITDGVADPDDADDLHSETLIRLPRCFLCYAIPRHAPEIAPPPVGRNGFVTFGSFNNLAKVNRRVIGLWARLLQAVPGSRLLLKATGTAEPSTRAYLRASFADAGIDPDRLELAPYTQGAREHLEVYNRVDIALDTFPYNGATTTCEALWMGVPVITLAGDRHAARVGASLLSTVGFAAGIAASEEEYLLTARLMAENPALLRAARANLRADMLRSPLCDMKGFARAVEEAYRAVWRLHCSRRLGEA
jgi:protein O-GlcNAc transferase